MSSTRSSSTTRPAPAARAPPRATTRPASTATAALAPVRRPGRLRRDRAQPDHRRPGPGHHRLDRDQPGHRHRHGRPPGSIPIIASPDDNPAHGTVLKQFTHQGVLAVDGSYSAKPRPSCCRRLTRPTRTCSCGPTRRTPCSRTATRPNNAAEAPNLFDVTPTPYADLVVSSVSAAADRRQRPAAPGHLDRDQPVAARHRHDQHQRLERRVSPGERSGGRRTSSPTWAASTTSARSPSAAVTRARSHATLPNGLQRHLLRRRAHRRAVRVHLHRQQHRPCRARWP